MFVYYKCYTMIELTLTTDISEEIDANKSSASKYCDIYHYWYFLNYSF